MESFQKFAKKESFVLEKGYKKATKKLSQLFQIPKEEKKGLFAKMLKKMKPSAKTSAQSNRDMSKNDNKLCTPATNIPIHQHILNDQHTTPLSQIKHTQSQHSILPSSQMNKSSSSITKQQSYYKSNSASKPLPIFPFEKEKDQTEWVSLLFNSHLFKPSESNQLACDVTLPSQEFKPNQPYRLGKLSEPPISNNLQPTCRSIKPSGPNNSFDEQHPGRITPVPKERDEVQEKLAIAAAKRNAIKQARLKEQMDLAWLETVEMMRDVQRSHSNLSNGLLYQKLRMNAGSPESSKGHAQPTIVQQPDILIW
ncbi:hypothetical protein BY458DRAFT_586307 [Sporodiniella umbellata]|nr:hypothetical protein BY458DRAFT_586307 [Sporodiniella umbellata]